MLADPGLRLAVRVELGTPHILSRCRTIILLTRSLNDNSVRYKLRSTGSGVRARLTSKEAHASVPSGHPQWLAIVHRTETPVLMSPQAQNLAYANSLSPALDAERPSSNATESSHVYDAVL